MADVAVLKSLSVEELRAELNFRKSSAAVRLAPPPSVSLENISEREILSELMDRQKVIYGTDNRLDLFQVTDPNILGDADSVVSLFRANNVTDNGNGTSTLTTQNFGTAHNLCPAERFAGQPIGAFCTGFLVGPGVVATAGHCINANNVTNVRFVFGFAMQNAGAAQLVVNNSEIYSGAQIVGRQEISNGADWALVRLDRVVNNHRIATIRDNGTIANGQAVHVIGHPSGLPTKYADGAAVRDNTNSSFFVANLDTYGGNSGSPVFNSTTHVVEGILVRGETDFVLQGNCQVSLVCPTTGCRGEDCTRTTEFSAILRTDIFPGTPVAQGQWGSIQAGHRLIEMHGGRVLDWVPGDGTWRLWNYDPTSTADIFPGAPVAQGQWSSIQAGHILIKMHDGRVLDWVQSDGSWRLWNYVV